ncbi:hypothetical protein IWW36_001889 [Coemansia brasiliensis]|uniref:Uncharacterized protein n=1 Tax=Coemansia brasiliensis TaxID=2650707 RepID=A0A9W8LZZ1_9FUNG|nr:hypothetical protein IWW36_001889 [Coemansia brasiliensis]
MRTFTAIVFASSAVLAQEVGFSGGSDIASGSSAISNPNVNNGWQSDSSLFASEGSGASTFNNVVGSSFSSLNANTAFKDNLVNNPSITGVKGNSGWTANGDSNALGPVQNQLGAGVFRRSGDVVFADSHHQLNTQAGLVNPGFVAPQFVTPQFAPVYPGHHAVAAVSKRDGDVVFAENHHQVNTRPAEFVPAFAPLAWPAFVPQPVSFVEPSVRPVEVAVAEPVHRPVEVHVAEPVVAPVKAEQNGQKATIVQNQA